MSGCGSGYELTLKPCRKIREIPKAGSHGRKADSLGGIKSFITFACIVSGHGPRAFAAHIDILTVAVLTLLSATLASALSTSNGRNRRAFVQTAAAHVATIATTAPSFADDNNNNVEAKSVFINVAKNYVSDDDPSPLDAIDWNMPKQHLTIEQMADAINDGLVENSWFVTGRGRPELFSDTFTFSDPQVSLVGYEQYCRSVRKLFDQNTARCELVCCSATGPDTITVLWRNSGMVNLGGVKIALKPYLVTTTLKTDPKDGNLIVSQMDEFDSDPAGLLLYQVPLLRPLAGKPAANVHELKIRCDFYKCQIR